MRFYNRSVSYRRAVSQLRGPLRVRAVGPLTERFGQLSLLHRSANALLPWCMASIQPGGEKSQTQEIRSSGFFSIVASEVSFFLSFYKLYLEILSCPQNLPTTGFVSMFIKRYRIVFSVHYIFCKLNALLADLGDPIWH